ncbi:MAG: helix-turn-helix domain-containing protein [Flavobacterium sp.]
MKVFIKFDINTICSLFLKQKLEELGVHFHSIVSGEIEINEAIDSNKLKLIKEELQPFGFEIIENQKNVLVQKIRDAIHEMIFMDNHNSNLKSSVYLSEKLKHGYGYLSNIFSDTAYTSIENFIILQKIERTKQLLVLNELNLTEIAFLLNYSSLSHLSLQFKNITGITPSSFQRIMQKRRANLNILS